MRKKIFILFAFVILFSGCQKVKKVNILSIIIDPSEEKPVSLSKIAENVIAIQLETKDSSLISRTIFQVEILDDNYIVRHGGKKLLVFDQRGAFVRSIGQIGKGPGEYLYCTDFAVDKKNKKIFLKTNVGIIVYDSNGVFLEQKKIKEVNSIYFFDSVMCVLSGSPLNVKDGIYNHHITVSFYDSDWNILDSISVKNYQTTRIWVPKLYYNITQCQRKIYLYYPNVLREYKGDAFYEIEGGKLKPYSEISFQDNYFRLCYINGVFKTERYIMVMYLKQIENSSQTYSTSDVSHYVYDTKTKESFNVPTGFVDTMRSNEEVIIYPIPHSDKFFYYKEAEYSADAKTEQNPVLYIGTFRK